MPFDQSQRNRLARFVADARTLLVDEFTQQLQGVYGMDPASGGVTTLEDLKHLDDSRRETARILRATLDHYLVATPKPTAKDRSAALDRLVREQAFTVLNRLCALRLAEARGIILEAVARGYQSKGFQLYATLAGSALGETGDAYRFFLYSLFDELAVDLPALFDRFSPHGRLFPREPALLGLLALIDHGDLEPLWGEDETIGWIYQYFNTKEERQKMRAESQAPRNSRELAVRNQFFTPRYVVEFLTDNTLGRIWYEMTRANTRLADQCRYLVRRPTEIFLDPTFWSEPTHGWLKQAAACDFSALPDDPDIDDLSHFCLLNNWPSVAERLGFGEIHTWAMPLTEAFEATGALPSSPLELLLLLYHHQRIWGRGMPDEGFDERWKTVFRAFKASLNRDGLSQEELLREPVFVGNRPPKDPRTLLMLDPACGSMHFGLYAFDLYQTIYDEAWEMEERSGESALERPEGMPSLHASYAGRAAFLRDVPRLIIDHNIHGIDIDPRAVQIAGLSLWLRAQRAWQEQRVPAAERPTITHSNIVCAEPMPGEKAMLQEYAATLQPRVLGQLVERVFEKMKLAGEAGSLLKIEEEIAADLAAARAQWAASTREAGGTLFDRAEWEGLRKGPAQGDHFDVADIPDGDFWEVAEARLLDALRAYAAQAQGDEATRRRLFAGDVEQGFAFIDLCRKRYDVVLMNPPFGEASTNIRDYVRSEYQNSYSDLIACFVSRLSGLLQPGGTLGAIASRTVFYLGSLKDFREEIILGSAPISIMADLGMGVLDAAMVETAAFCLQSRGSKRAIFIDVKDGERRDDLLGAACRQELTYPGCEAKTNIVPHESFRKIPGSPLSYWLDERFRNLFLQFPAFEDDEVKVRVTNPTADNFRFLRNHWECRPNDLGRVNGWVPYAKGGESQKYYYDVNLIAMWDDSVPTYRGYIGTFYRPDIRPASLDFFFKPGLMWPLRADRLCAQAFPEGTAFSARSQCLFAPKSKLPFLLGLLNSAIVDYLFKAALGRTDFPEFIVGILRKLPKPAATVEQARLLGESALGAAAIVQRISADREIDRLFSSPPLVRTHVKVTLALAAHGSELESERLLSKLATQQTLLDKQALEIYGISDDLSLLLTKPSGKDLPQVGDTTNEDEEYLEGRDLQSLASGLGSYALGVTLGRWDIRFATGERQPPPLPDPFAPLPVCPPGMLQNEQGLPAAPADLPAGYPLRVSWGGILVDDPGHPEDVEARLRDVLQVIWGERAGAIEEEACQILGVDSLRAYMRKPAAFFDDHLKRYSKSRRAAPIYWPLSTPSGSYTLWLYYHRLTDQTLYRCVNDFVDPRLKQVEGEADRLRRLPHRSRADEGELERLSNFEAELRALRAELLRIAAFWKPNLNDGVQITAAPLYRLFQHKPWQKRLRETWEKLEAGDFDWAHLAYSSWPERVKQKCVSDKSLAIAHDLEHLYDESLAPRKKGKSKVVAEEEMDTDTDE